MLRSILFLSFLGGATIASATPSQIMIIRHAEKPPIGNEVNQQGCERAYLLPGFFSSNPIVNQFGPPVAFFAARPDHTDSSLRPLETIAPTAQSYGLSIQDPYTRLQYQPLTQAILSNPDYSGKTVVLSWEHDAIPGLAQAFGAQLTSTTQTWPDTVFDEAWILDFTSGNSPSLQIIPEAVLPGDNPLGGFQNWGNGPSTIQNTTTIPSSVVSECVNDDALKALALSLATPSLKSTL